MKAKTIKKIIRSVFNSFLQSIEDSEVKNAVSKNTIITGGCITSMLLNEKPNDFDMYFTDLETTRLVAEYFVNQYKQQNDIKEVKNAGSNIVDLFVKVDDSDERDDPRVKIVVKSSGVASSSNEKEDYQYFETIQDPGSPDQENYIEEVMVALKRQVGKPSKDVSEKKFRPIFITSNAITLTDKVQLVLRFYGNPEKIHQNYDFVHCTSFWESKHNKLVLRPEALEAILTKELVYKGSKYPICSIIRMRKFLTRGWTINAGQILKMAYQCYELDLKDPKVLEDQLTGVDVAYFTQLLGMLKDTNPDRINSSYIAELIDKIF